jgi:hypothetical protein
VLLGSKPNNTNKDTTNVKTVADIERILTFLKADSLSDLATKARIMAATSGIKVIRLRRLLIIYLPQ